VFTTTQTEFKTGGNILTQSTERQRELQLRFDFGSGKPIEGQFDAGRISSDGGLVLVRAADEKLELSKRIAMLADRRQLGKIKHEIVEQIRQRLYMITAGHEDHNDADKIQPGDIVKKCREDFRRLGDQITGSRRIDQSIPFFAGQIDFPSVFPENLRLSFH